MGFGGSVAAMIASLKNNKRERTTLYDKDKKGKNASGNSYGAFVDHKKMSPEQFKVFQQQLRAKKKAETKRQIILYLIFFTVMAVLVAYGLYAFHS